MRNSVGWLLSLVCLLFPELCTSRDGIRKWRLSGIRLKQGLGP